MYQILIFILFALTQVALGERNPLANEEPLYNGSSSPSSSSSSGTSQVSNLNPTASTVKTATTSTSASQSTATSTDCKMDENILLCLCETKFSGQKELCITAAGQDNVLYAFQSAYSANQNATPGSDSIGLATSSVGIDPALLSLFLNQQGSGGMGNMEMLQLMQLLFPMDSPQQQDVSFNGEPQFSFANSTGQ